MARAQAPGNRLDEAAVALAGLGGPASAKILDRLSHDGPTMAHRNAAIRGRARMNLDAGAARAAEVLAGLDRPEQARGIVAQFTQRKGGVPALAKALAESKLDEEVALAGIDQAGRAGVDVTPLKNALQKAGGIRNMAAALPPEEVAKLVAKVAEKGDPHRGEKIYRRQELTCAACHAIGGVGSPVGPDLVSIGASAPVDYLIESLLEPNKKIKEGYHTTVITTKDGQTLAGAIEREGDTTTVLRNAAGQLQEIPTGSIAKKEVSPISLMPPGLTARLREDEFVDLVRFLSELGKDGPFKSEPGNQVRQFRTLGKLNSAQADALRHRDPSVLTRPDDQTLPWTPRLARVDASIPLDEFDPVRTHGIFQHFIQFTLPDEGAKSAVLEFTDPTGLKLWNHKGEVPVTNNRANVDLQPGENVFVLSSDPTTRKGKPIIINRTAP